MENTLLKLTWATNWKKWLKVNIVKVLDTRFFDIHYFVEDDHTKNPENIINLAKGRYKKASSELRPLLNLTKS